MLFPKRALSFAQTNRDVGDIAAKIVSLKELNMECNAANVSSTGQHPLDKSVMDTVVLVVSIRGDTTPQEGN